MPTESPAALRVLIVDDEALAIARLRAGLESAPPGVVEIVGEVGGGAEAIAAILTISPDVVFLDIHMPDVDGFGVLRTVGAERMPATIFVTAYDQHALAAFNAHAIDYVLKPFSDERLLLALEKARFMVRGAQRPRLAALARELASEAPRLRSLSVRSGNGYEILPLEQVEWLEAEGNQVRIHLRDPALSGAQHRIRSKISALEESLDPDVWARVHRGAIVRRDDVRRVARLSRKVYELAMKSGARVTTTASYAEAVHDLLGKGEPE